VPDTRLPIILEEEAVETIVEVMESLLPAIHDALAFREEYRFDDEDEERS
jgi:hypothetical protein